MVDPLVCQRFALQVKRVSNHLVVRPGNLIHTDTRIQRHTHTHQCIPRASREFSQVPRIPCPHPQPSPSPLAPRRRHPSPQRASARARVRRSRQAEGSDELARRGHVHRDGELLGGEGHPRPRRPGGAVVLGGVELVGPLQRELLEEVLCATIVEEQRCDEIPRSDCPTARRRPWSCRNRTSRQWQQA